MVAAKQEGETNLRRGKMYVKRKDLQQSLQQKFKTELYKVSSLAQFGSPYRYLIHASRQVMVCPKLMGWLHAGSSGCDG